MKRELDETWHGEVFEQLGQSEEVLLCVLPPLDDLLFLARYVVELLRFLSPRLSAMSQFAARQFDPVQFFQRHPLLLVSKSIKMTRLALYALSTVIAPLSPY